MRITTTAFLGLSVIVLAILIYLADHKPVSGKLAAERANVLLRFEPESIERIEVEKGTAKTSLVKKAGLWFFSEPEQDRVDASLIASLLDTVNHLSIMDRINPEEAGQDLAQLGLTGDSALKVTFSGAGETGPVSETVTLGSAAPRANSLYARREGKESGIFVVDGNLRPWLENPLETLRDRRILGAPIEAIVQVVLRQAKGKMALQRKITPPRQDWAIVEPLNVWADREALDKLLTELGGLKIEEVVSGGSAAEEIPNPLPENSAVLQLQIYGIEQPLTLYLKQVEAKDGELLLIEVRVSDRPSVYRLKSDFLTKLPGNANDIRDRTLARIPMEYLDSIIIQSHIDPTVILKSDRDGDNVRWDVRIGVKLEPANSAAVFALINSVNEAAIIDFTSDSVKNLAEFGLNPPARQVTFNLLFPGPPLADGSPRQVQEMTRVLNLGWREGDEQRLFANFAGEPYVYELDPTFVNAIPTHPIKWRSLKVLTFNRLHLNSITRELGDKETLKLTYDNRLDQWGASRSGVDTTPSLDRAAANRLRDRLGGLTASGWYLALGPAYEALQTPSAKFNIVTTELDPAINEPKEVSYLLKFAPSTSNLYFGQIEGSPDVFFLDRETYQDLIRPVMSLRVPPR